MTLLNTLRIRRAHRRAVTELACLSDRDLHDAGIPRWRIREIVRGAPVEPHLVL